jgi:hypothetical protein
MPKASPKKTTAKKCCGGGSCSPSETQVQKTAYKIWEKEGKPEGKATEHWNKAKKELTKKKK